MDTLAPGTQLGKYTLIRRIAMGGMAELFLAVQQGAGGFQKTVAIKRILPGLSEDPRFVAMFLNEARLAALLSHPAVAQIYELGEEQGLHFIVMEYVDGPNVRRLAHMLRRLGRLIEPRVAAAICARAAEGLDHAHRLVGPDGAPLHMVHRDVSPENILVSKSGNVKLVDFGIAKAMSASPLTTGSETKGKFAYMSPEQVRGQPVDGRSDQFSLGVVLYVLATGVAPFRGESHVTVIQQIATENPEPPRKVRASLPRGLEQIILRLLNKDPQARFPDAAAAAAALDAFVASTGAPVSAGELAALVGSTLEAYATLKNDGGDVSVVQSELVPPPRRSRPPTWVMGSSAAAALALVGSVVAWQLGSTEGSSLPAPTAVAAPLKGADAGPDRRNGVAPAAPVASLDPPDASVPTAPVEASAGQEAAPAAPATAEPELVKSPSASSLPGARKPAGGPRLTLIASTAQPSSGDPDPAPGRGTLVLEVPAGVAVYVDDRRIGKAPLGPLELSAGRHVLRLIDVLGGKTVTRPVRIEHGKETRQAF